MLNLTAEFGVCPADFGSLAVLISAMSLMGFGNVVLLVLLVHKFKNERMEILILNQVIVDLLYTAIFPLVILDARREMRNWSLFYVFKVLEDSLLTLSVLAVVFVALFKHIQISGGLRFRDGCARQLILVALGCSWLMTPIIFSIRNSFFICVANNPCASSYFKCITSHNGVGEISSILFYLGCAALLLAINCNFIRYAMAFQSQHRFRRNTQCQEGRRILIGDQRCAERRLRHFRIILYPLMTGLIALVTITPFWVSMALCQSMDVCMDDDHSLFYLMRLHSVFNPYATILTYRRFRHQLSRICFRRQRRTGLPMESSYGMMHWQSHFPRRNTNLNVTNSRISKTILAQSNTQLS